MTPTELIRGLENERNRLEGKRYNTFELDVSAMIDDCISVIKEQRTEIERLEKSLEIARCGYEN